MDSISGALRVAARARLQGAVAAPAAARELRRREVHRAADTHLESVQGSESDCHTGRLPEKETQFDSLGGLCQIRLACDAFLQKASINHSFVTKSFFVVKQWSIVVPPNSVPAAARSSARTLAGTTQRHQRCALGDLEKHGERLSVAKTGVWKV